MSDLVHRLRRFARDRRGVGFVEFALGLPLLLGFTLGGVELANFIIANNATQRLASMSADMMSQAGMNNVPMTEANIYDLFYSLDVSAQPLDMRNRGRIILTVIKGVAQSDGSVRNEFADSHIYSQQFDGGLTTAVPLLGCHSTLSLPSYRRTLPANEIMVHAQVSYLYQPVFVGVGLLSYFDVPGVITRTAVFRMRKNQFNITNDGQHPSKNICTSATGL
jgi:hypothetical protein